MGFREEAVANELGNYKQQTQMGGWWIDGRAEILCIVRRGGKLRVFPKGSPQLVGQGLKLGELMRDRWSFPPMYNNIKRELVIWSFSVGKFPPDQQTNALRKLWPITD